MTSTDSSRPEPAPLNRVHVVWVGGFGKAVARYLTNLCGDVQAEEWTGIERFHPNVWSPPDVQIVAAWRPVPPLCEFLDERCHQHVRPFVPLIVDSSALCIGPIIVPAKSGCWKCWQLRSQQHSKLRQERSALLKFYETNLHAGPAGYLEPFAMMGAAKVAAAIQSHNHLLQLAGHIWQTDLFTREVSVGYLTGVDGCPRCGLGRPLADRTSAEMQEKLAFLWRNVVAGQQP